MKNYANNDNVKKMCQEFVNGPRNIIALMINKISPNIMSYKTNINMEINDKKSNISIEERSLQSIVKEINKQKEIDKNIKREIENNKYALDDPLIIQNPYDISPLTALVIYDSDKPELASIKINGTVDQNKLYSRAVIYNIDENNKTVKQDWQYGKERGKELYSSFVNDVDYLGENHYLIDFGGQYKDDNGTVYDHIYTDAKIKNASNKTTTLIEILNDKVIFEAILYGNSNSNSYKAERKDIYQGM